jgi:hypothetical protein
LTSAPRIAPHGEKTQTAEQHAATEAWHETVRESQRQRGLIALVFLIGNIMIVVTCIRSTRANTRETGTGKLRPEGAFVRVLIQGAIAFGVACAIMIVVPVIESVVARGHGMYSGEQMLSAIFTIISFLFFLTLSLGLACVLLWRRSRAHP